MTRRFFDYDDAPYYFLIVVGSFLLYLFLNS